MACKILFIHYGGGIGGAPVSILQLAAALDRRKYQPVVVFTESGPIMEFAQKLEIPVRVVPMRSAFFYSAHVAVRFRMLIPFIGYFRSTVQQTIKLVRQENPDLVHLNTSVLIPAAVGVKRERIPLVWHVREVPGNHAVIRRWQTRAISRFADHIIANSHTVREAFPEQVPVTVVHNALDLDRFKVKEENVRNDIRSKFNLDSTVPVVGMIGSIQAEKGHYHLAAAAKRIVQQLPSVRFLMVAGGVGPEYETSWKGRVKKRLNIPYDNLDRMRRLIAADGLENHFIFTGFRSDIPELLSAMDILAFLPQAAEGFGRPLLEAMAMGRPVVATDIGPTREITGKGTGVLVPPGDGHAISNAIIQLLTDPEMCGRMGASGRRRVEQKFAMSQHVQATDSIYRNILDSAMSKYSRG